MKIKLAIDIPWAPRVELKKGMICEVVEVYDEGVEAMVCNRLWISKEYYEVLDDAYKEGSIQDD